MRSFLSCERWRRCVGVILVFFLITTASVWRGAGWGGGTAAAAPRVTAQAYAVLDLNSGQFLLEHAAEERRAPASLTKVATALVCVEQASLEHEIRVSARAANTDGNRVGLYPGERLEMWELLYGLLFKSGNDAATALAEGVSGSEPAFVAAMNRKVAALGLRNTHFANPHGLDTVGHYSTARDLAWLGRALLANSTLAHIVGRTERHLSWDGKPRDLTNINRFLQVYPGALGVKTGFTDAAGYCLIGAANRGGRRLLAVVLGAASSGDRYQDASRLLDAAYAGAGAVETVARRPSTVTRRTGGDAGGPGSYWHGQIYVVRAGDTLTGIARRLGLTVASLTGVNPAISPDHIHPGQRLRLP